MTTQDCNPMGIDITPVLPDLSRPYWLMTISGTATSGDAIRIANSLAIEALELVEEWPSESPIPLALTRRVRELAAILNHLENGARV